MVMMMRGEDFMKMMEAQKQQFTPEQEEHHRRLEYRIDRYRITLVGDDPIVFDITQKVGRPSTVRMNDEGLTIAHFPDELENADPIDERAEHKWEENGHSTSYPWNQVASVEHWWWVDEDAAKTETVPVPGQYL